MTTQYYVSGTTGNDGNDGLAPSRAKKTVQAMLDAITDDCTINITAGIYTSNSYYHLSAAQSGYNIVLQGGGSSNTSLVMSNTTVGFWLDSNFTSGSVMFTKLKLLWTSTDAAGGHNGIVRVNTTGTSGDPISIIIGSDAVIGDKCPGSSQRGINFSSVTNGQYRNLVMQSGAELNATEYGVYLNGCGTLTLGEGTVNSDSDAFFVYNSINAIIIDGITINSEAAGLPINPACTVGTFRCVNSDVNVAGGVGLSIVYNADFVWIDNNVITSDASSGAGKLINVGYDGEASSAPIGFAYVGRNTCRFMGISVSHGLLIGDGVDGAIVEHNIITGGDYSFVLKSDKCTVRNNYFESNNTAAALIKHGACNNFQGNTCVGTGNADAFIWKPEGSTSPLCNRIEGNVFAAENGYAVSNGGYTSTWNCIFDYNDYYTTGSHLSHVNSVDQDTLIALRNLWQAMDEPDTVNDVNSVNIDPDIVNYIPRNTAVLRGGRMAGNKRLPIGNVVAGDLMPMSRLQRRRLWGYVASI